LGVLQLLTPKLGFSDH